MRPIGLNHRFLSTAFKHAKREAARELIAGSLPSFASLYPKTPSYSPRSVPQKNRATVPGPVCAPIVVPM